MPETLEPEDSNEPDSNFFKLKGDLNGSELECYLKEVFETQNLNFFLVILNNFNMRFVVGMS